MNADDPIWERLVNVFRTVFQDPFLQLNPRSDNNDIDGWDSLKHAILIDAIENEFNISLSFDDILLMQSIETIYLKIKEKKSTDAD